MKTTLRSSLLLLALVVVSPVFAVTTATGSGTMGYATVRHVSNIDSGHALWEVYAIQITNQEYAPYQLRFEGSSIIGPVGSTFEVTNGQNINLRLYSAVPSSWTFSTSEFLLQFQPTAQAYFKIKFQLPVNSSDTPKIYKVYQNGVYVGATITRPAGSPAMEWTVTGLTSDDDAELRETTEHWTYSGNDENGNPVFKYSETENYTRNVGMGSPVPSDSTSNPAAPVVPPATTVPAAGPTPAQPPLPPVSPTLPPTNTPLPSAPLPRSPAAPPTPIAPPNTPSGTDGTTKADTELQTNQLTSALNEVRDTINENSNTVVGAINDAAAADVAAITTVTAALNAGNEKLVESQNKTQAVLNSLAMAQSEMLGYKKTEEQILAIRAANTPTNSEINDKSLLDQTAYGNAIRARNLTNLGTPSEGLNDWEIATSLFTVNINPSYDEKVAEFCALVKSIIGWLIAIYFEMWVWRYFSAMTQTAVLLPQSRGNTVAGSGGQATAWAAALIITGVMISLPTLYFAAVNDNTGFLQGMLEVNPTTLSTGAMYQRGIYLLGLLVPLATLTSAVSTWFIVKRAGVILVGTLAIAIRYVIP